MTSPHDEGCAIDLQEGGTCRHIPTSPSPRPANADRRDSRVERLAVWFTRQNGTVEDHREAGSQLLGMVEAAGLLVLLPDEALAKRIENVFRHRTRPFVMLNDYQIAQAARAVLAALAGDSRG